MVSISRLLVDCGITSGRYLAHERIGRSGGNTRNGRHAAYALTADGGDFFGRHGGLPRPLTHGRHLEGRRRN